MYQYSIGVVDDELAIRSQVKELLTAYENEHKNRMHVAAFASAEALLEVYRQEKHPFQILILDVEMPGMSGMEAAKQIRAMDPDVCLLFLTAFEQYAVTAFEVDAVGYLMKPIQYVQLKARLAASIIRIDYLAELNKAKKRYLTVMNQYQEVHIEISEIVYIEKRRNQSVIHCREEEYVCYESLRELYERLDPKQFCYSHQGYLVNFSKVQSVGKTELFMENHAQVPLSRRFSELLYERKMEEVLRSREQLLQREEQYRYRITGDSEE